MAETIEDLANAWMVRTDRGLSASEERALAEWLGRDPRHEAAFEAAQVTVDLFSQSTVPLQTELKVRQGGGLGTSGWRAAGWGLAAAAVIALGLFGWRAYGRTRGYEAFETTEPGLVREVVLPDRSVVRLSPDTAVTVHYTAGERQLELVRGEGRFSVAKNAARPFTVTAKGVQVRAVGTAFGVRLGEGAVNIAVTEGRVRIARPAQASDSFTAGGKHVTSSSDLVAGEELTVRLPVAERMPATTATAGVNAPSGHVSSPSQVVFESATLEDLVRAVNANATHPLVIADEGLKAERFGGTFPSNDQEAFVKMLEADFGIVAERRATETLLRRKR